jgi:phosphatidylserine decarboxylase
VADTCTSFRREAVAAAALSVAAGALLAWLHPLAAPLGALPLVFTLWFFRDPERTPPPGEDLVLAPADGVLDDVREEPTCPFFPGPALRLGIFLSLLDVHVNRVPISGRAVRSDYRPGARAATYRVGATDANEQLVTWFEAATPPAFAVVVRQIAGPVARRVSSVLRPGDAVVRGQRFGLIKFGSRTELWLPAGAVEPVARKGERVRGGETVLARRRDLAR